MKLQKEMESLLEHETDKMKRKFSDPHNNDPLSIIQSLSGKDPVQIIMSVHESCSKYFSVNQRIKVDDFIQSTLKNKALRRLFLLAIYKGAYSAHKLFPNFFDESSTQSDITGVGSHHYQQQLFHRSEGLLSSISCQCYLHNYTCKIIC